MRFPITSNIYRRNALKPKFAGEKLQPWCGIKELCGGCEFINTDYDASLQKKFNAGVELLKRQELTDGVNIIPAHPSPRKHHYRSQAKLVVQDRQRSLTAVADINDVLIGLYERESHDAVHLGACPVHAEGINELIADLRELIVQMGIVPYDEKKNLGTLRYVVVRRAHVTGALMMTLVCRTPIERELKALVKDLKTRGHQLASVYMNIHPASSNGIFGPEFVHIAGAKKLREGICRLSVELSPNAFFQINPWTAEIMYRRIEQLVSASYAPAGDRAPVHAWDFFCGTGQIALLLARSGYQVLGIEMNADALQDAQLNAQLNELSDKTTWISGRVEDVMQDIPKDFVSPKVVVVNPSRKGIPEAALHFLGRSLAGIKKTQLIYMSCEMESLARDLVILRDKYNLRLRQVEGFDMFPFTSKMEWLAVLTPM